MSLAVDSIWSQSVKRVTAAETPLEQPSPLPRQFDAIKELSEEEFSRSQSFNNLEGICIETSPVNKVQRSCDKFSFELNIHDSARNSKDKCLQELLREAATQVEPEALQEELEADASPVTNKSQTKLDKIIEEVMRMSHTANPSQSTAAPVERTSDNERNKPASDNDKSNERESSGSEKICKTAEPVKSQPREHVKPFGRSHVQSRSATKGSSKFLEVDGKPLVRDRGIFDEEYQDPSEKDSLQRISGQEEDKHSCQNSCSLKTDIFDHYRTTDYKRMSLCENFGSKGEHKEHWIKRSGTFGRQSHQLSKEYLGKKRSLVFFPNTNGTVHPPLKKRSETLTEPLDLKSDTKVDPRGDLKGVFRKKNTNGTGGRSSPEKGEARNSSSKIKFLKA